MLCFSRYYLCFVQLQNSSVVSVGFKVLLASLSPSTSQDEADRVSLLLGSYTDSKLQPTVGKLYLPLDSFTKEQGCH